KTVLAALIAGKLRCGNAVQSLWESSCSKFYFPLLRYTYLWTITHTLLTSQPARACGDAQKVFAREVRFGPPAFQNARWSNIKSSRDRSSIRYRALRGGGVVVAFFATANHLKFAI